MIPLSPLTTQPRPFLRGYLAAFAVALLVLGGHFWMIDKVGSPVPLHDQWQAEGEMLYLPLIENRLTLNHIVHPHSEHRIIPTRLLALGLFKLNNHIWDVRLQMTVNAVLAAILATLTVVIASRQLGRLTLIIFATAFGALFASPLFYGNALWGFQSQFYFLLLFSVAHLDFVLRQRVASLPWTLGVVCAVLAWVSMGSGFFSAAVVALMSAWTLIRIRQPSQRRTAWVNLAVHACIVGAALWWSPGLQQSSFSWSATVHTLLHCLSWPQRFFTPWGAWIWLPFIVFVGLLVPRKHVYRNEHVVVALGLWVLAQIVAISLVRSAPAVVITPRYYEIFWLGLVVNALALHRLWGISRDRWPSITVRVATAVLITAWIVPVSYKAWSFAQSHARHDLAAVQSYTQNQQQQVKAFLATDDIQVLQALPYPHVPHPDPAYLAGVLRNPTVRSFLPAELTDAPVPVLSRWANRIRGSAGVLVILGVALLLVELWQSRAARYRVAAPRTSR